MTFSDYEINKRLKDIYKVNVIIAIEKYVGMTLRIRMVYIFL